MNFRGISVLLSAGVVLAAAIPSPAAGRTIRVPEDYATINRAVGESQDGDVIDVADGFYFERNIVIDKKVLLRSRHPYGAVVSGSGDMHASVFIVRAECEISGFIIKNAGNGIIQRDSPDFRWTGNDLAVFDCFDGISINDRETTIGAARLSNIILDRSWTAVSTNDARELEATGIFVSRSEAAFTGFNHVRFFVDQAVLWNNRYSFSEGVYLAPETSYSKVETGPAVFSYGRGSSFLRFRNVEKDLAGLFRAIDDPAREKEAQARRLAIIHMIIGETLFEKGDWKDASEAFARAASGGPHVIPPEILWRIDLGLGRTAEQTGNREAAAEFYRKSIAEIDQISRTLLLSDLTADFRSDKIDIYESLISILLDPGKIGPDVNRIAEALDYAEQAKARSLLLDMPEGSGLSREADPAVIKGERRLAYRLSQCQRELQDPRTGPERRGSLQEKLRRIEADRNDFYLRAGLSTGSTNGHQAPPSAIVDLIRSNLLRTGEALVEYFIGKKFSYAFFVTRKTVEFVRLPPEDDLSGLVRAYCGFLSTKDASEFTAWEGGYRLWKTLLGPFEGQANQEIDSLIIVPDGPLAGLPFEALVSDTGRKRFLIEDFPIRYAPSAAFLARIRAKGPLPSKPREFLGISKTEAKTILDLYDGRRLFFSSLPFARREIRDIARLFSSEQTTLLNGRRIGEAELKSARLDDYRFIHFAVHNRIDESDWRRSFLLLGPDGAGVEDGFLQPEEIRRLRLDAELVVLSGCSTARGVEQRGEGRRGISTAFLRAGARALLISHWAVDDAASAKFMTAFYRDMLTGKKRAEALREVKLSFLRSKRRHPVFWAPFVLIG